MTTNAVKSEANRVTKTYRVSGEVTTPADAVAQGKIGEEANKLRQIAKEIARYDGTSFDGISKPHQVSLMLPLDCGRRFELDTNAHNTWRGFQAGAIVHLDRNTRQPILLEVGEENGRYEVSARFTPGGELISSRRVQKNHQGDVWETSVSTEGREKTLTITAPNT